ncbi:MAG: oligoendopeptidase F [Clostridia bacterium]|nr:oligoendopeptidase F [Clostridia bacterium]
MNKVLERSQVDEKYKWSITDLFENDDVWQQAYDKAEKDIMKFDEYRDNLTVDNLLSCLKLRDEIMLLSGKVCVYAGLRANEDSTDNFYQGLDSKSDRLITLLGAAAAFIEPAILALPEDRLRAGLDGELKEYKHYIEDILRSREHILSADKEELLAQVYEIGAAPSNIFYMLNNADIEFENAVNSKGEKLPLTHGTFVSYLESADRELRKSAFDSLYNAYFKQKNTLAAIYTASVKKDVFNAKARNYSSSLEGALSANNIPVEVYTRLVETVNKHLPLMHRYIKLRKRILGLDDLDMYDIYTPVVEDIDTHKSYDEAVKTVLEALKPMGKEYCDKLKSALYDEKWVDIYENKGKRSGAYSWGAYGCHPFVSLNYNDTVDSMFTLAHEMGHAMHSHYTWSNQPFVYGDYTIFVAEVASTVNEALLMEHLLKTTDDVKERKYLLNYFMEQFRGTLFRQTMFAEFELITHSKAEKGEPLTFESLCEIYGGLNKKYYGDEINSSNEKISWEWSRIPHFYTAFYVYQYATGYSAAITLSQKILNENGAENYINFLKGGSSGYSIDLLKGAGVDMTGSEAVENAMKVFEGLLDEFEKLV